MKGELKDYEKRSYDENPVKITYYVHGQKATKAEYSAYIKKLPKIKQVNLFQNLNGRGINVLMIKKASGSK